MGRYEISRDMVTEANNEESLGISIDLRGLVTSDAPADMPAMKCTSPVCHSSSWDMSYFVPTRCVSKIAEIRPAGCGRVITSGTNSCDTIGSAVMDTPWVLLTRGSSDPGSPAFDAWSETAACQRTRPSIDTRCCTASPTSCRDGTDLATRPIWRE